MPKQYSYTERSIPIDYPNVEPNYAPLEDDPEAGGHGPQHAHKLVQPNVLHTPPTAVNYSPKKNLGSGK